MKTKKFICENCKQEVTDSQKFCTKCGKQLLDAEKIQMKKIIVQANNKMSDAINNLEQAIRMIDTGVKSGDIDSMEGKTVLQKLKQAQSLIIGIGSLK